MICLLFIIGLFIGSFYFVVATRLPKNESIVSPRSHCDACKQTLKWYELIPIISYIFLGGKCKNCHKRISLEYPIIELITGVLFSVSYLLYGFSYEFLAALIIFSLVVLIFISDFKYMIILDSPLILAAILIIILKIYYFGYKASFLALLCGSIMFVVMFLVKKIGDLIFKKESLGGGDIKLSFVIGIILGLRLGLTALILSSFLAMPYAVATTYLNDKKELPFGPFIISALAIVFIFMDKFIDLLAFLFPIA